MSAFRRELSCGVAVLLDDSLNIVIVPSRERITVTNVDGFVSALHDARDEQRVQESLAADARDRQMDRDREGAR